jgi:hypothetical protein
LRLVAPEDARWQRNNGVVPRGATTRRAITGPVSGRERQGTTSSSGYSGNDRFNGDALADEKHEGLLHGLLDDAAERSAVNVDRGLASDIVVAELRGLCTTKGVTDGADSWNGKPAGPAAASIGGGM